jgi:hypothetical protein
MGCEFRTGIRFSIPAAWFIRSGSGIKPPSLRNALGSHGCRNLAATAADGVRPVPIRGAPGLAFGGKRASIPSRGFGFRARHAMVKPPLHT